MSIKSEKLEKLLKNNGCFKLICGAGNEDVGEVEKLTYLYSNTGCNFFDVSANIDVIKAAKAGIVKSGNSEDKFLCVSVALKGDRHTSKAYINPEKCRRCLKCFSVCPQSAIKNCIVNLENCIGCGKCYRICAYDAIKMKDNPTDLKKVLPEIINEGVDCIELHANSDNEDDIYTSWKYIHDNFDGMLSLCISRMKFSDEKFIKVIEHIINISQGRKVIVQTDGYPISGGIDDFNSTLQAVACADIVKKANLPVYVILSGGTNSKTKELAEMCGVEINGIAVGSYARKIINEYLCGKINYEEALKIASKLVQSC